MVMGISTWVRKPQVFPTLDQAVATIVKLRSDHPLKVEVSYRNRRIAPENVRMIRGIRVYSVDALANMKARAYLGRDKLRDLFDICFICKHHMHDLSPATVENIKGAIAEKGLDQVDFVLKNEPDPLIDRDKLITGFLELNERLGLQSATDGGEGRSTPSP